MIWLQPGEPIGCSHWFFFIRYDPLIPRQGLVSGSWPFTVIGKIPGPVLPNPRYSPEFACLNRPNSGRSPLTLGCVEILAIAGGIALEWIAPQRHTITELTDLFDRRLRVVNLVFAIVALATALMATSVKAQMYDPKYPVCMHVYGELEGERMDCIFTSLAQCAATASGRPATCLINPYFAQTSGRRKH
jgi:hypothetical protein